LVYTYIFPTACNVHIVLLVAAFWWIEDEETEKSCSQSTARIWYCSKGKWIERSAWAEGMSIIYWVVFLLKCSFNNNSSNNNTDFLMINFCLQINSSSKFVVENKYVRLVAKDWTLWFEVSWLRVHNFFLLLFDNIHRSKVSQKIFVNE
jgi:hypothetical protein